MERSNKPPEWNFRESEQTKPPFAGGRADGRASGLAAASDMHTSATEAAVLRASSRQLWLNPTLGSRQRWLASAHARGLATANGTARNAAGRLDG